MLTVTLLPRKNKIGIASASVGGGKTEIGGISWHPLPEQLCGDGLFSCAAEFAQLAETLIGENLRESSITLCLEASHIPAFVFTYTPSGARVVEKMRALELKTLFGENAEAVYTSDKKLGGGKPFADGKCRTLIYSVEKAKADALITAFSEKKLRLERIVPFNALFEESVGMLWAKRADGAAIKAALYAGDYDCAAAVFADGMPLAVRAIEADAFGLVEAVMHYFKISEQDARKRIMQDGLEEFSDGMADDVWLYEKVIGYYREIVSAAARAVNSVTSGGEKKVSGVLVAGEFSEMKNFASGLAQTLTSPVLSVADYIKDAPADFAFSGKNAVECFPLYASPAVKNRLNLLDEKKGEARSKRKNAALCAVLSAAILILMLIMPLKYYNAKSALEKLNSKLATPVYAAACELESRVEAAAESEREAESIISGMPAGKSRAYACVDSLLKLTEQYGTIVSIEYGDNMNVTLNVSCTSYQLATGWKNAVIESDLFSFISSPPILRTGVTYELNAQLKFISETQVTEDTSAEG